MIRSTAFLFDIFKNLNFQARLIERTPSMSDLNEVIFGQVRTHSSGAGGCLFYWLVVTSGI